MQTPNIRLIGVFLLLAAPFGLRSGAPPNASDHFSAAFPRSLLRDLNRDGRADAVVLHGKRILVELAGKRRPSTIETHERPMAVTSADIDRDGDPDLVVLFPHGHIQVLTNNGRGRFAAGPTVVPQPRRRDFSKPGPPGPMWDGAQADLVLAPAPHGPPLADIRAFAALPSAGNHLLPAPVVQLTAADRASRPSRAPPAALIS